VRAGEASTQDGLALLFHVNGRCRRSIRDLGGGGGGGHVGAPLRRLRGAGARGLDRGPGYERGTAAAAREGEASAGGKLLFFFGVLDFFRRRRAERVAR
jgi:hypothetical protein